MSRACDAGCSTSSIDFGVRAGVSTNMSRPVPESWYIEGDGCFAPVPNIVVMPVPASLNDNVFGCALFEAFGVAPVEG